MRHRLEFFDYIVLVLRKAMFSREIGARIIAVKGFVMILRYLENAPTSSEGDALPRGFATSQSLFLEILGFLRRCTTQQFEVRSELYSGLAELYLHQPHLRPSVIEILFDQFSLFYEPNGTESLPPLRLEKAVEHGNGEGSCIREPLPDLLRGIRVCVLSASAVSDEMEDDGILQRGRDDRVQILRGQMDDVVQRMAGCELEELELDKSTEFSQTSDVGFHNQRRALVFLGCLESLMEYVLLRRQPDDDTTAVLLKLFDLHRRLQEILADKAPVIKGKKMAGKAAAALISDDLFKGGGQAPVVSVEFTARLLRLFTKERAALSDEAVKALRENATFRIFVLATCMGQMKALSTCAMGNGTSSPSGCRFFKACEDLLPILLHFTEHGPPKPLHHVGDKKKDLFKGPILMGLETAEVVLKTLMTLFSADKVERVLKRCQMEIGASSQGTNIFDITLKRFEMWTTCFVSDGSGKEAEVSTRLMQLVLEFLPSEKLDDHLHWASQTCHERQVKYPSLAKALILFHLNVYERASDGYQKVLEYAQDLFSLLGPHQAAPLAAPPDEHIRFAIVSEDAQAGVISAITSYVDNMLDEIDILLDRLKESYALESDLDILGENATTLAIASTNIEELVCTRLDVLLQTLGQTVVTDVSKTQSHQVFAVLVRIYKAFGSLAKTVTTLKRNPSKPFQRLVVNSAKLLTNNVYTFLQSVQDEASMVEKKRAGRESRLIPNLIYQIEQYERFLIKLSKQSKVDLMKHFKRSQARDFRLQADRLEEELEREHENENEEDGEEGTSTSGVSAPQPVRQRNTKGKFPVKRKVGGGPQQGAGRNKKRL